MQRLRTIRFPLIDFRDATPADVVAFLVRETSPRTIYREDYPPSIGLINTNAPTPNIASITSLAALPHLTYHAENVTLLDAITVLSTSLGIDFDVRTNTVIFRTKDGTILNEEFEQPASLVPGSRGTPPADAGAAPRDPAGER